MEGMASRALQNSLGDTKLDRELKVISYQVLSLLHVQGNFLGCADDVQLQCWQFTAQVYFELQKLRKKLTVPSFKFERNSETLFTENEVRQHN